MPLRNLDLFMMRALKHKYFAKRTKRGDIKFPSKLEADCFSMLEALQNSGKILFFLRQIPVFLDGGVKHVIDFLAFGQEEAWFLESKAASKSGRAPMGELKRKQAEEKLGVQIHVVTDPKQILAILFP